MRIGEVSLLTNDVPRLAAFYAALLGVELPQIDPVHQFILTEETMLTVYNDGTVKSGNNRNMCLAFTVEDIHSAHKLVQSLGAQVLQIPTRQPWGAVNMSFLDPDGNMIFLRQLNTKEQE